MKHLITALALIVLSCGGAQAVRVDNPTPAPTPQTYAIGDTIQIADSEITVLSWQEIDPPQFIEPDEGKRFVAVELRIINKSNEAGHISSLLQMALKDEAGRKFDANFTANLAVDSAIDGELAPGETIRGWVGFQVPEGGAGFTFVFEPELFRDGKVFVRLGE